MNYQDKINNIIDFIGDNIDSEIGVNDLCKIACLSKYHFHRIFTVYVGMSLHSYIRWLRLKRTAYQLASYK